MWFLEHDLLFGGARRVWLRPGSQQLFGRTKSSDKDAPDGKTWKIDNKAVSRKHVMLRVLEVRPEDGTKLHSRSQIEITDLSCRQGTAVDNDRLLKSRKAEDGSITFDQMILGGTEHTIRLAQGYPPFRIAWRPAVFTYASKETKDAKARSAQLHALDVKTTTDFVFDQTTHVVSQKRNLPKVLSGLVLAKHIVTPDFLDTVLKAATASVDTDGNYVPSKLEEDFDAWWPKEKDYLPPVGAEPVPRPQEMLEPDQSRSEVFSGLTIVFLNANQYNSLHEPISGGGGKALLFDVRPGETTVQEYVDYVLSIAGQKKRSKSGSDMLSVITVRLSSIPDGMEDWATNFVTGVDQALNQRSVLQNEFLDVIITKDRTLLQLPPAQVQTISSSPPEASLGALAMQSIASSSAVPVQEPAKGVPRKRPYRTKTPSRFTGFDDYEPPSKIRKVENTQTEDIQQSARLSAHEFAPNPSSQLNAVQAPQTRFAPPSPFHESGERDEQMETLFPAAAEIKRRRAATRAPSASAEPEVVGAAQHTKSKGAAALEKLQRAKKKAEKDINIREETRLRVKEEEDRKRADEESLREALEGIDITEMRNLAKVEEMEIHKRQYRGEATDEAHRNSGRWNPDWNGRKNFKKFRRRGTEQGIQTRKVIVSLEEAPPRKGFGVGDALFLEDAEHPSSSGVGRRREQDSSSDVEPGFMRRNRAKQPEVVNIEETQSDADNARDDKIQRSSGRTQKVAETQLESLTQTQRTGRKRTAAGAATGQPIGKRGKTSKKHGDSDEEETGFRFKRRT